MIKKQYSNDVFSYVKTRPLKQIQSQEVIDKVLGKEFVWSLFHKTRSGINHSYCDIAWLCALFGEDNLRKRMLSDKLQRRIFIWINAKYIAVTYLERKEKEDEPSQQGPSEQRVRQSTGHW